MDNVDASLWPSALNHSCYLWNTVPKENNYAPIEILSSMLDSRNDADLRHTHVWGCPVYILEYELASGKKLPKWSPRSRHGVYLGVSSAHSSNVPLVLSLKTGSISAQYHVVFDDCFLTVVSGGLQPQAWDNLFSYNNQSWNQLHEEYDEPSHLRGRNWRGHENSSESSSLLSNIVKVINNIKLADASATSVISPWGTLSRGRRNTRRTAVSPHMI